MNHEATGSSRACRSEPLKYPTPEEVERADMLALCYWHRFLLSPGMSALYDGSIEADPNAVEAARLREAPVMDRITARVREGGGFTPTISKTIGWVPPGLIGHKKWPGEPSG